MTVDMILLHVLVVAAMTVLLFLLATMVSGTFSLARHRLRGERVAGASIVSPLLSIIKQSMKASSARSEVPGAARRLVLAAWTMSTLLAFLFVPYGSFSLLPNLFGQFQLPAIFGLLMVFPVGLMVLCFVSERKVAIHNLRFLAEDFFSSFLTFVVAVISILVLYFQGFVIPYLPSLDQLVAVQTWNVILVMDGTIPALFLLVNPLTAISLFAIVLLVHDPFTFTDSPVSVKWTPLDAYSGKSRALVTALQSLRFLVVLVLLADMVLAGMAVTAVPVLDGLLLAGGLFLLALVLSVVKARTRGWILDKKIGGFLRVHNVIALAGLLLSAVLVLS